MAEPWRLLALPPLPADLLEGLFGGPDRAVAVPPSRDREGLLAGLANADIVVGDWSGKLTLPADVIAAAPRLAFVQQPSAGVDSIDVDALTRAGVPLANAGAANANSVAEWCLGATFAALRSLPFADAAVRSGGWPQLEISQRGGGELSGRRVGVVGMGRIGVECAWRFVALGCDVAHWSRRARPANEAGGARWVPLDDLLARSDVLVVVVALSRQTRNLLDGERLARLPHGAIVVNAARGGIVDEAALLAAVRSGALSGAALDVFADEPLPENSELRSEDRILLSPHAAGASREAQTRLIDVVSENLRLAVAGRPVHHVVNGVDPVVRRR